MSYKKRASRQEYLVERKNVLSSVESKVKKAARAQKQKFPKPSVAIPKEVEKEEEVEVLGKGQPATLHYNGDTVKITTKIRYETMKTEPLIKTVHMADGKVVFKRFVGPAKQEVWVDDTGKEHDKNKVELVQQLKDGSFVPVVISKTKDINVEPVDPRVMDEFQPYSFIEVWGEDEGGEDALRDFAFDLVKNKKIGAVEKFSHGFGKVYVGFIRPVLSKDGKSFTVEMTVSENKKKHRRWMVAEKGLPTAKPKQKLEPEIPKMW